MTNEQKLVVEFHHKFKLPINSVPVEDLSDNDIELRNNLILEEAQEFADAEDIYQKADALADLLYVVYGAAVTYGIDLEPIFNEVHRSNMSKLWTFDEVAKLDFESYSHDKIHATDERCFLVKRKSDNKVIKSPSYSPADIKTELWKQLATC